MTRNNSESTRSSTANPVDDETIELPDLSALSNDEKQHILEVLVRDEDLRNQRLSRFAQLHKEVAELRQHSQSTSKSACARCQTPFGYIFNTGDTCPKCSSKVCKQCRLIYNVNDNSWLCQLCCKEMQLLSYSGEWIRWTRDNLRNNQNTNSEIPSISPASSVHLHDDAISSTDSEVEVIPKTTEHSRFHVQTVKRKKEPTPANSINRMIVQNEFDESKLIYIRNRIETRPNEIEIPLATQPLPRRNIDYSMYLTKTTNSSEDVNSQVKQSRIARPHKLKQQKTVATGEREEFANTKPMQKINGNEHEIDTESRNSSTSRKSSVKANNHKSKPLRRHEALMHGSRQSLTSITSEKSASKRLSGSVQNLRQAIHRISQGKLSSSRTSLNSEKKAESKIVTDTLKQYQDTTPIRIPDEESKTRPKRLRITSFADVNHIIHFVSTKRIRKHTQNERTDEQNALCLQIHSGLLSTKQNSQDNCILPPAPTDEVQQSPTDILKNSPNEHTTQLQPIDNTSNITDNTIRANNVQRYHQEQDEIKPAPFVNNHVQNKQDEDAIVPAPVLNHQSSVESNTGVSTLRKVKQNSQSSLNSGFSDAKANYDYEISGTMELKLSYNLNTDALDVFIKKCSDLARPKRNQTPNPYCKLYLLPDKSKATKRKTQVIKDTIDPEFHQSFRYRVNENEFNSRTLSVSVWSQTTLGHNEFLGEINIPLIHCILDQFESYTLLPHVADDYMAPDLDQTEDNNTLYFQLSFIVNATNKDIGTLQISSIQATNVTRGKQTFEIVCKGLLMPDKIKRKLASSRKGPSPKWDIPLQWENISRSNLKNTSVEISLWRQERFRKSMMSFIRLHSSQASSDNKLMKSWNITSSEKAVWEAFLLKPTKKHEIRLPLRPATNENK